MFGATGDSTFVSDIFGQFRTTPLQDAASGGSKGGVITAAPSLDQFGNVISDASQYIQVIDPLTGQVSNQAIPPGYVRQGGISDWLSHIESDIGSTGKFMLTALALVAAIMIVPKLLKE